MGVEPEKKHERRPEDELLGFRSRLLMGAVFASLYIATFGPRGTGWLPGIISGVLGGAVVFLILKEVDERRRRRRQRRSPAAARARAAYVFDSASRVGDT